MKVNVYTFIDSTEKEDESLFIHIQDQTYRKQYGTSIH